MRLAVKSRLWTDVAPRADENAHVRHRVKRTILSDPRVFSDYNISRAVDAEACIHFCAFCSPHVHERENKTSVGKTG